MKWTRIFLLRSGTNKILWETTDYKGRVVELTEERRAHIQSGHPEVTDGYIGVAKNIIEEPEKVVRSKKYEDTEIHMKFNVDNSSGRSQWFNVVVNYHVGNTGDVRSAYFSPTAKTGDIVYVKAKK